MSYRLEARQIEWVSQELGTRLDLSGMADLVDALIDAVSEDEIAELLDLLSEAPQENARRWKWAFALLLKHLYLALALAAVAGALAVAELERVQALLAAQYAYLERFAQEVEAGSVSVAQAGARMRMYVNSARSAFWTVLDQRMREAGYSEEKWIAIGDANTCTACMEAHGLGWQPIGTFAEPGSGYVLREPTTECQGLTRCRCRKEYR